MRVLALNSEGKAEFERFISDLRQGINRNTPTHILKNPEYTEEPDFNAEVSEQEFNSRYDLGVYLNKVFSEQSVNELSAYYGLWDWLALYYFDLICPLKSDGTRKNIRENARYLCSELWNRRYRHAVYPSWQCVKLHGENAKILLDVAPDVLGEIAAQILARQQYISWHGLIEALNDLYMDNETGKKKSGAGGKAGGAPRRIADWLNQIDLTYDMHSISAEKIIEMLPGEFDKFKPGMASN